MAAMQALIAFGMGLGFLLAFLNLAREKTPRITYSVIMALVVGVFLMRIHFYLNREQPFAAVFLITAMFASGPVFLFQLMAVTDFALIEKPRPLLHFIPAMLAVPVDLYIQWQNWQQPGFVADLVRLPGWHAFSIILALSLAHLGSYASYIVWQNIRLGQKLGVVYERYWRMLVYIPAPSVGVLSLGFLVKEDLLVAIGGTGISLTVILMYLISARHPDFFDELNEEIQTKKYQKTVLTGIDVDGVRSQLNSLMTAERIYRDEALRLPALAERLSISPNQLSRIINEHFGKSFNDLLHAHRIEEAQARLLSEPKKTITTIAFEVGFANKATFNKQFIKLAGQTPQQYRRSN